MVQTIYIPWAAWYGDLDLQLDFPDSWNVNLFGMKDANEIKDVALIEREINNPIGTPKIQEIAKGKQSAAIVVEDISRPTKTEPILTVLLRELNAVGIGNDKITIIPALGAHRPMQREDFVKKLGSKIVNSVNIENHHPYENLVYIGDSKAGTPIYLNKTYHQAEVKIAVGTVVPHPLAGFGGGAKIILPGVCGIQTLEANHKAGVRGIGVGLGIVTELRKDIEDVCQKAGLDFTVNVVSTMRRGIAGIFAGHFVEAHRKAMELAKKVYATELPPDLRLDVAFFNLYPEDTELSQALKGLNFFLSAKKFMNREGSIVLLTAASEGRGFHSLQGETGGKLYQNWGDSVIFKAALKKMIFGVVSPNVNRIDVLHYYPERTVFKKTIGEMISELEKLFGKSPKAGVFPCSLQMSR